MTTSTPPTLPAFVCLASRGNRVLAYCRAEELPEAHGWCREARLVYLEHADQLVLAKPEKAEWFRTGRSLEIVFVTGWMRIGVSWQVAKESSVRLNFDELPRTPTSIEALASGADVPPPSLFAVDQEIRSVARTLIHLCRDRRRASASRADTTEKTLVLLVNEDAATRAALHSLLLPACEVAEADDFTGALLELAYADFDVVIAHHCPDTFGSGIELLTAIRDRWPHTRRVLCVQGTLELRATVEAGVAHHIVRHPLDPSALMAAMATPRRNTL